MKHRTIIKLLYFSIVALIAVYGLSQATATDDTTTLLLDRKEVNYLFNLPTMHVAECLFFKWTVKTDSSHAGQIAVLQFSHDGEEWNNLANTIVDSNGMASNNQSVDSSWAVEGRNYLRVVIEKEASNLVIFTANVGIGYWIIGGTIAFISVIVVLWYFTTRIKKLGKELEKLQTSISMYTQGREMALALIFGLVIRITLAPWTEQRFDNYANRLWCSLVYGYNLYPFEPHMPIDFPLMLRYSFPPIWLFIALSLFPAWLTISGYNFPNEPLALWKHGIDVDNVFESYRSFVPQALPLLDLLFKLPNIVADVGIGYLLYKLADNSKYEKIILFGWFLNPYTIHISTVWGLFDPLCTFFTFFSVYLLWKRKFFSSAVFLSFGVTTKMYPLFFLIPVLIYVYRDQGLEKSRKYFFLFLFIGTLIFSSFLLFPGGLEFIYRLFIFKASPDMYGRNLISGLTWMHLFSAFQPEENFPIFPLIFIPLYIWLNHFFWKNSENDFDSLVTCLVSVILVTYLSYTVVNPQYVYWVLPFLLYLTIKSKFSKRLYMVFTVIPLVFMYACFNPLQFISPAIVWEEWNYPPLSDVIEQLWPKIFNSPTIFFIELLFCFVSLFSLVLLNRCKKASCKA